MKLSAALTEQEWVGLAASAGRMDGPTLAGVFDGWLGERLLAYLQDNGVLRKQRATGPRTPEEHAFVQHVFDRWKNWMRIDSRVKLTPPRQKFAVQRFREGSTREDVEIILTWAAGNDWMMGRDPRTQGRAYNDFDTLFGSSAKFSKYLKLGLDGARRASRTSPKLAAGTGGKERLI